MGGGGGLILHNIPRISILPEIVAINLVNMEQRFCLKDANEIFTRRKFYPLSLHNKALTESKRKKNKW